MRRPVVVKFTKTKRKMKLPKAARRTIAGPRIHAADVDAERKRQQAIGYSIRFYAGPGRSYTETAPTLCLAIASAQALNAAHGHHGRRACIYATQPDGRISEPVKYDHG